MGASYIEIHNLNFVGYEYIFNSKEVNLISIVKLDCAFPIHQMSPEKMIKRHTRNSKSDLIEPFKSKIVNSVKTPFKPNKINDIIRTELKPKVPGMHKKSGSQITLRLCTNTNSDTNTLEKYKESQYTDPLDNFTTPICIQLNFLMNLVSQRTSMILKRKYEKNIKKIKMSGKSLFIML